MVSFARSRLFSKAGEGFGGVAHCEMILQLALPAILLHSARVDNLPTRIDPHGTVVKLQLIEAGPFVTPPCAVVP